jgi:hypothetical protein
MRRVGSILPLLMVAACDTAGSNVEHASAPGAGAASTAAVALALLQPSQGGATAASAGVLAVRGRCLVLEAAGIRTNLAFATPETAWDSDARTLRVGSETFRPGDPIEVGGALFTGDSTGLPWLSAPAAECRERLWIVSSIGRA